MNSEVWGQGVMKTRYRKSMNKNEPLTNIFNNKAKVESINRWQAELYLSLVAPGNHRKDILWQNINLIQNTKTAVYHNY